MAKRTLEPYREASLTPLMKWSIIVGGVLFTIIMMIVMQVPSLAQWSNWWLEVGTTDFGDEKMKGFDEWATDPENKGVYPRGEQKDVNDVRVLCINWEHYKKCKCTDCGRHETTPLFSASGDGSETKFLGYIPSERKVEKEPVETCTDVTIKKEMP